MALWVFKMLVVLTFVLLSVVPVVHGRYPRNSEGRIRDFLLNQANYSSQERPVLDSSDSVRVGLYMQFYAMLDLNERDESITTASWLVLKWQDERMSWNPDDFNGTDLILMNSGEVWTPKLYLSNSLETKSTGLLTSDRGQVLVTSEGKMQLAGAIVQSTQCPVRIVYFPFDSQECVFKFLPENQIAEQTVIYAEPTSFGLLESNQWELISITEYSFAYPGLEYYVENRPTSDYSSAIICVVLKRDPTYYIATLIIPSTLLCVMAFVTFLAPPDSGERISLGVSMVLGLTVFQLLVAEILPTASKDSPILNTYLTVNFVMACLAVPFSLFNINIAYGDSKLSSIKVPWIRRTFLEILPSLLLLTTYAERIREEILEEIEVKPLPNASNDGEKELDDVETEKAFKKVKKNTVTPLKQLPIIREQNNIVDKKKLQARTVALVMDRIVFVLFLVGFCSVVIYVLCRFSTNENVSDSHCL